MHELKEALRPLVQELVREALGQLSCASPADLRERSGLTRDDLVRMVPGLTFATLCRYENGAISNLHHPSVVRQMRLICKALGVDFSEYRESVKRRIS